MSTKVRQTKTRAHEWVPVFLNGPIRRSRCTTRSHPLVKPPWMVVSVIIFGDVKNQTCEIQTKQKGKPP